jgi:drug/metabolite transporter (DMT)-like permease
VFAALLCTLLFSLSITCGHRSAKLIGGTEANFWRLVVAGLCLGVWAYAFGVGTRGEAFPLFFLSGAVGIGIGDMAFFQTLPRLGSRLTSLLINCLSAPFAALIEWFWMGTALTRTQIIWGMVTVAGVGIALKPSEHIQCTRRILLVGTLFSILAALCGAAGGVLSRKAYAVAHIAGPHLDGGNAGFQRSLGGLLLSGALLLVVKRRTLREQRDTPYSAAIEISRRKWRGAWPWVLVNGFAGQTLGVSCMQWALETTPAGIVFAILALTPIVIIPFASALEGERLTLHSVIGGGIAVGGVIALTLTR